MKNILLNVVWPALYVSEELWRFWFLVIGTILIETFVIKIFLKFSLTKSIIASIVGNCVSGFIGTFVMMWAMLLWHLIIDRLTQGTFANVNWIATFILMCLGSVFLETLTIKRIYKEKIKRLFFPMLIGNFLTYGFIAYVMLTKTDKDPDEARAEQIKYVADKSNFVLLDNSQMKIDTALIKVSYDKNNEILNEKKRWGHRYNLYIPFKKQVENSFQFELRLLGEEYSGGINDNSKDLHLNTLKDTIKVLLEQKNADTSLGWTKPIITDTINFTKQ